MFRDNKLAVPVEILLLVLHKLDVKHLLIFMRVNTVCRRVGIRDEIWQRKYASDLPLNNLGNRVIQNWFQLFCNHYRLPNKKFICDFLKLYPACNDVSEGGQATLREVETKVLSCVDFEDWFKLICLLRKTQLNVLVPENQIIKSILFALAKYMIDTMSRMPDWVLKADKVVNEIGTISVVERLDEDPNRNDQLARFTKKNLLLEHLAILRKNSRLEVRGVGDIYIQHFQPILRVDLGEFKRMSEKGELDWRVRGNRFRGA